MLLNFCHKKGETAVTAIFCFILCIGGVSSLARVDNNWALRRPNVTVPQNQRSQPGYRPAAGGVAYQQPLAYKRNNQTLGQQQWHSNNNRSAQHQQNFAPVPPNRTNQTHSYWNQTNYAKTLRTSNQTRPVWAQQPSYPASGQGTFNQSRPVWSQPSANGYGTLNQSRPAGSQPLTSYTPQNPAYGQTTYNHSRSAWPQPSTSQIPQIPAYGQGSFNQTRPTWSQPSAPLLPNYPQNPTSNRSHLYPSLPSNANSKPALAPNSWSPSANQTLLYPQLPNPNMPQPPAAGNSNGIPLAPLQPQPNAQGPHNWHSGGQSVLSYGPGYYPPPADNTNKTPPNRQGSSNPYANMFI